MNTIDEINEENLSHSSSERVCHLQRVIETTIGTLIVAIGGTSVFAFVPGSCWAAGGPLPWDQTLSALQDILVGPVVHAAIVLNFACSAILYALGSRQFAGRLLAGGFASCAALIAIRFLTYLFPF